MKEKYISAYEHIQMLRGICYGIVTTNDLRQTAIRYGLSDEESQELADRLQREGVHLHTEEEKYELLPTMLKFHGVELPPIPKPPTPDERLTKIMCGEPPAKPYDLELYNNVRAAWELRIAADALATEVYQLKRNGATLDDIAQRLETSADNVLIVEEKILRAFRYAVQKAGHRRVHLVRAKKIRDYYQ